MPPSPSPPRIGLKLNMYRGQVYQAMQSSEVISMLLREINRSAELIQSLNSHIFEAKSLAKSSRIVNILSDVTLQTNDWHRRCAGVVRTVKELQTLEHGVREAESLEQSMHTYTKDISALTACLDAGIGEGLKESLREQIRIKEKERSCIEGQLAGRSSRDLRDKLEIVNCRLFKMCKE